VFLRKNLLAAAMLMLPGLASAYVGPGAGISLLGALWGLLLGIFVAVGVVLFWPIRTLMRKMRANKAAKTDQNTASGADATDSAAVGAADIDSAKTRTADHNAS